MASSLTSIQATLGSSLPAGTSLVVVFVPNRDRDGNEITQDYWVDEVLTTLGLLFRGATAYPKGKGVWRDDERGGALVREEPVIVFSYAPEEAMTEQTLTTLAATLRRMGREANQGEIGVVIDGKYFGISKY